MMQVLSRVLTWPRRSVFDTHKVEHVATNPDIFLPRFQSLETNILTVLGLPAWTGASISCDVICNSQLEPADVESS